MFPDIPFPDVVNAPELNKEMLADTTFHIPDTVDLLIGAGVWAAIIQNNLIKIETPTVKVVAQDTQLGYVVFGKSSGRMGNSAGLNFHLLNAEDNKLDQLL